MITITEDEEIELRTENNNIINFYDIYLKDRNECAGYIKYRGYHCGEKIGDVGYVIYPKYRGHNYAYKALILLSQHLNEFGIEDFWITCNIDNVSSKKTIEKYTQVKPKELGENILLYECQTLEKEKTNKK